MMNTGDALDFPIKLHAGRVLSGCGLQVFSGAQFGEHLALDAPLFTSGRHLEKRTNRLGGILSLEPSLAKYTSRGVDLDTYWFVQYGMTTQPYEFTRGSIFHLMEPDLNQEIYGLPEYLSAIPSALLNESATLYRRKYYINGSHAGFIMYMTDAAQNQEDVNNIR